MDDYINCISCTNCIICKRSLLWHLKKAVLVYILEILKSETDANHTLSQEEIRSILAERYEVSVDRKTLGRHLNDLYESGDFGIQCEESAVGSDGTIRRTDFYMIHTFEDSELRIIN